MIGGVGGAIIIGVVLIWFLRKRRSNNEEFDGDFDPDRVVRPSHGPDMDLLGNAEVTPFGYNPATGPTSPGAGSVAGGEMSQRQDGNMNVPPFLAGGMSTSSGPSVQRSHTTYTAHTATSGPSVSAYSQNGETYYSQSSAGGHYPEYANYANFAQFGQGAPQGQNFNYGQYNEPYQWYQNQPGTPSMPSTTDSGPSGPSVFLSLFFVIFIGGSFLLLLHFCIFGMEVEENGMLIEYFRCY